MLTFFVAYVTFYIVSMTAAPYPFSKLNEILELMKNDGLISGIRGLMEFLLSNLGIIGWGIFLGYYKTDVIPYRISSEEYIRQVVRDEEILARYIDVSKENSEWENTVVVYNNSEMLVAALPAGVGINTVMDYRNEAAQKSQYLLMSKQFEDYENIKIDRNVYGVLYEDDRMLLYGKMH